MPPTTTVRIKAQTEDSLIVEGYGVIFGGKDLYGDTFTADTDFMLDYVPVKAVLYDHRLGDIPASREVIGKVTSIRKDDVGLLVEAELDKRAKWRPIVEELLQQDALGWSSGSIGHMVDYVSGKGQGVIKSWPIVEFSLTPTPAEPRTMAPYGPGIQRKSAAETEATSGSEAELAEGAAEAETQSAPVQPEAEPVAVRIEVADESEAIMAEETVKAAEEAVDSGAAVKALRDEMDALKAELAKPVKSAGYAVDGEPDEYSDEPIQPKEPAGYKSAWRSYIRRGTAIRAAMQVGTDSEGGYTVPVDLSNELVQTLKEGSILRRAGARILYPRMAKSFSVPTLTDSAAAVLTAEEAAFDQKEPTFGVKTFTPYKYTKLVKVSDELLTDSLLNVESQVIIPDAANAFALAENGAFTTGTGSAQPEGFTVGGSLGKTTAGAAAITADEILDLFHSLNYLYRDNAVWMMHGNVLTYIRKLKDTTNQYLLQPGLNGGPSMTILGRPVIQNDYMASAITTGQKTIVFGNFSYFWIADFGQYTAQRLNELYAANGQVGFRFYKRFDSRIVLSSAIKWMAQA